MTQYRESLVYIYNISKLEFRNILNHYLSHIIFLNIHIKPRIKFWNGCCNGDVENYPNDHKYYA